MEKGDFDKYMEQYEGAKLLFQKIAFVGSTGLDSTLTFPVSTSFPPSKKILFLFYIFNKEMKRIGMKLIVSFPAYSLSCLTVARMQPRCRGGKESPCQCRRCRRLGFDLWVRKIPWSRK